MAKITRKFQKIFGLSNDGSQRFGNGQFGSGKAGTKIISNNVETLQLLAAFDDGWKDAVLTNSAGQPTLPPLPEMQALDYIETYQLAYLFQEGIPEYNADTTYFINSIVKVSGTYQLYGSIVDNNIGNSTSDPTKWALLVDLSTAASTNTLTSVDGEIVLFSSTGGRTLKRATTTGLLKATSGVLSAASAGTDYLTPSGSSAGLSAATTSDPGVVELATNAEVVTGTDTGRVAPVSAMVYHSGISKASVAFNGTGTVAILYSYNVTSITDNAIGDYSVNFTTNFANANYIPQGMVRCAAAIQVSPTIKNTVALTASVARITTVRMSDGSLIDSEFVALSFDGVR